MTDDLGASQHDVARTMGESALAGGIVGLAIAAAAFVAARFVRFLRQPWT